MNIFEGSRRIAIITALLWSGGCIFYTFIGSSPSVSATYEISNFGMPPTRAKSCPDEAAVEYTPSWNIKTPKGTYVSVTLCFLPVDGFSGAKSSRLIPYKVDPTTNKLWGAEKYSSEVSDYTKKVARNFQPPESDFAEFDAKSRSEWWKDFFSTMGVLVGGLVLLWGFTGAVGYVVRGFMGIPMKSDSRINE